MLGLDPQCQSCPNRWMNGRVANYSVSPFWTNLGWPMLIPSNFLFSEGRMQGFFIEIWQFRTCHHFTRQRTSFDRRASMSTLWLMLSSMICGAPNMRHGRNAFAWEKKQSCCFVFSNLSGKRICGLFSGSFYVLFLLYHFFCSGSLMSMAPLFHTFLWGQAFRNLHKLVRRDGMIINMIPAAGCWPNHGLVEYEPRFFQSMAGRIRLWVGVDFTPLLTLLYAEKKNIRSLCITPSCLCRCSWLWNHQSFTSSSCLPVVQRGGALLLGPYLWPCRECLRWLGCSPCCGRSWFTHEKGC